MFATLILPVRRERRPERNASESMARRSASPSATRSCRPREVHAGIAGRARQVPFWIDAEAVSAGCCLFAVDRPHYGF
jgi:hypothetical protein